MSTLTTVLQLLNGTVDGDIPDHTQWNAVTDELELFEVQGFCELIGAGVFSPTDLNAAIGAALSVDVSAGRAIVGDAGSRRVVRKTGSTNVPSLTNSTTNYIFLQRDGTFAANTTGTPPANTLLVASAVAAGGAITSVNNNPTGRVNLANSLLGGSVNVADANPIGGVPFLHRIDSPNSATGNTDVVVTLKSRVIDVWLVKTAGAGGASDTITVQNGANAITDAMSINVADKAIVRAATLDDAFADLAAGGTLRIARAKVSAANVACTVYVLTIRIA